MPISLSRCCYGCFRTPLTTSLRGGALRAQLRSTSGERGDLSEISRLALPALISQLVDPFLSLVDTAYCGRLGALALASLGPCVSIFHLSFNMFGSIRSTTTALVSQALAQSEEAFERDPLNQEGQDAAAVIAKQSLLLSAALGCVVGAALLSKGHLLLHVMGLPRASPLFAPASHYLRVRALASPAFLCLMAAEGIFRGHGDTRAPLAAALVAAFTNMALDPLLMFGPWARWGLGGAAAASAAAQYAALGVFAFLLRRKGGTVRIGLPAPPSPPAVAVAAKRRRAGGGALRSAREAIREATAALGKALPVLRTIAAANTALLARMASVMLCWAAASGAATRMGPAHAAAHQVTLSIWLTLALVTEAPAVAGQILAAKLYSAGQVARLRSLVAKIAAVNIAVGAGLGLGLFALGLPRLPIFMAPGAPEVQALLTKTLVTVSLQLPLVGATLALEGVLVGLGAFQFMAGSQALSTAVAAAMLHQAATAGGSVADIWSGGLTALFVCRFAAATAKFLATALTSPSTCHSPEKK